ncbi:MAG: hypothetical protein LBC86_03535 [Oscillospiraceae bacterium]|jgi:hypothetical protein|nr:hypothetical protein [Oscillospiraceae bacterium]
MMKKILSTIIIFVILSISASAVPPPMIMIESEEELFEMREMVNASDKELEEFLFRTALIFNGMSKREHVVMFLELLDSLPIPYETGMRFAGLVYYPTYSTQDFSIFFTNEAGEQHSFNLTTKREREEGVVKRIFRNLGEEVSLLYTCQDNRMRVYSRPHVWDSDNIGIFRFPMEIDGLYLMVRYFYRGDECVSTVTPESIYGNMIITSFAEAPWSTISPAVVEELIVEEPLTTADAMTVLRAVAGLTATTDEDMARFEIDSTPTTADALRILRIVAGL